MSIPVLSGVSSRPGSRPGSRSGSRPSSRGAGGLSVRFASCATSRANQPADSCADDAGVRSSTYIDHFPMPAKHDLTHSVQPHLQGVVTHGEKQYNGYFVDYLSRQRGRRFDGQAAVTILQADGEGPGDGADIVSIEKLVSQIADIFLQCYKKANVTSWKAKGTEFKDNARTILRYKRQHLALNAEVKNWIHMDKLLHPPLVLQNFEPSETRQNRLGEFWSTFHNIQRMPSTTPEDGTASGSRQDALHPSPVPRAPSRPASAGNSLPLSRSQSQASGSSAPGTRPSTPLQMSSGDAWKARASRSLCSRGGSRPSSSVGSRSGIRNSIESGKSMKDALRTLSFPSLEATANANSEAAAARSTGWAGLRSRSGSRTGSRLNSKTEDSWASAWFPSSTPEDSALNSRACSKGEDSDSIFDTRAGTRTEDGWPAYEADSAPSPPDELIFEPQLERHSSNCSKGSAASESVATVVTAASGPAASQPASSRHRGLGDSLKSRSRSSSRANILDDSRPNTPASCRQRSARKSNMLDSMSSSAVSSSRGQSKGEPFAEALAGVLRPGKQDATSRSGSRTGSKGPTSRSACSSAASAAGGAMARSRFVGTLSKTLSVSDLTRWGFNANTTLFGSLEAARRSDLKETELATKIEPDESPEVPELTGPWRGPPVPQKQKRKIPHADGAGVRAMKDASTTAKSYTEACNKHYVLPCLLPFCTGHSDRLEAQGLGLTDGNLLAVIDSFPSVDKVYEVNLDGNRSLTAKSMLPLLSQIQGPRSDDLRILRLKHCMGNSTPDSIEAVVKNVAGMMGNSMQKLRWLDLSGIAMTAKAHLPLCNAISNHPALKTVGLADIKLGADSSDVMPECIDLLLASGAIQYLDLSWNVFDDNRFTHLGLGVVNCGTLTHLGLAGCACSSEFGDSTVEVFAELLELDRSLKSLDVSYNRIDFKGALVFEAALERNTVLRHLDMQFNPLSQIGFRSMLRTIARDTSGLMSFQCHGCCSGIGVESQVDNVQVFSETALGGRYHFQLRRPYDRALLKMLYRTSSRLGLDPEQAFVNVIPPFKHPARNSDGSWTIPKQGEVSMTFHVQAALEKTMACVGDDISNWAVLDRYFAQSRLAISFKKQVPLMALWAKMQNQTSEQRAILEALSKDFQITCPMVVQMCTDKTQISEIAQFLIPHVAGGLSARYLSMLTLPSHVEYLRVLRGAQTFFRCNMENPNGHYELHLESSCDFAIAEHLFVLDRWESYIAGKSNLAVVSEGPERSQLRNVHYQSVKLTSVSEFVVPEHGWLSFDYSSLRKPPVDSQPLSEDYWRQLLLVLQSSKLPHAERVKAVSSSSHLWYLNALQMRALMGIFESSSIRAETFVRLATRLIDIHNEKIFRSRFADHAEFRRLLDRLGHCLYFPCIQPEQTHFVFEFSSWEQRLAANMLIRLSEAEGGSKHLADATYTVENRDVPPDLSSWQHLENIPESGSFSVSYVCSADEIDYSFRKSLLEKYCNCHSPSRSDVMWWSSIIECPPDVVEFVEFANGKFKDIWEPFAMMSSTDAAVSLGEFEDGLKAMGCHKFRGENESERIKGVFQFLDPSGEGSISKREWQVMSQIFVEIELSVSEFVDFCVRTFGPVLQNAWQALDSDGSGEIDWTEWAKACNSNGFFGPTRPIFSFLDTDDEGTISEKEFALLQHFVKL
eukprot:TRINITY_DN12584_c0_g6_i1.p1 TRINITY_DN12584_c0_g6~~TRINITY_DN12584_c0_g6_i1.p1  ORF type:complete len:1677 (-),score=235.05 TRINITY_DN12584_c0_g6_i1:49-5079(-)